MTTIDISPKETEKLKKEVEKLKTEIYHIEKTFNKKYDEMLSRMKEQLEIQATRLDGEIKGRFFERAKLIMWLLTILFFAATAGGWWNVSNTIPIKVSEKVESETKEISEHIIDTLKVDLKGKLIEIDAEISENAKESFDKLEKKLKLNADQILNETKSSVINSVKEIRVKIDDLQKNSDYIVTAVKPVYLAVQLFNFAASGDAEKIEELHDQGADINFKDHKGKTALIMAAIGGHLNVTKHLLALGARVDFQDVSGRTALIYAAANGYDDIVVTLLNYSALMNLRSTKGSTALIEAVDNGHFSAVKILLQFGDDPNSTLDNGQTPLILAASNGDSDIVQILLDAGADSKIEDKQGETALTISHRLGGREEIKTMLMQRANEE